MKKKRRNETQDGVIMQQVLGRYLGPDNQPIEKLACGHMVNAPNARRTNRRRCHKCEQREQLVNIGRFDEREGQQ